MTHLGDITPRNVPSRGIRSQFFRLRSCSKIFESGSENFSNLGIRLLFTLRLMFLLEKSPRRLLLLLKLKSDSESVFFHKFLTPGPKEKRRILPSATPDPWPPLVSRPCLFTRNRKLFSGRSISPPVSTRVNSSGGSVFQVGFPVRVMKLLGVEILIATNAAGGINESYGIGDFMLIKDHISMVGMGGYTPLKGPNDSTSVGLLLFYIWLANLWQTLLCIFVSSLRATHSFG